MRKTCLFFILLVIQFSISTMFAQISLDKIPTQFPVQNFSLNVLGSSSLISLEYERTLWTNDNYFGAASFGLGYNQELILCLFGNCNQSAEPVLTLPHRFTYNLGKKSHFFEMGLGGTLHFSKLDQPYLLYPIIGYRFHSLNNKRVIFRLFGHIPILGLNENQIYFSPIGISLGTAF